MMLARLWVQAQSWRSRLRWRARAEGGASAVEYAVLAALIIGILIVVIGSIGQTTSSNYGKLDTAWP